MIERLKVHGQMSESMMTIAFLTMSGGLQDAYSYCVRGKVFANAQTGNIVLMSGHFFDGQWAEGFQYLVPILFFAFGVFCCGTDPGPVSEDTDGSLETGHCADGNISAICGWLFSCRHESDG